MSNFTCLLLPLWIWSLSGSAARAQAIEFATFDVVPYVLHDDPEDRSGLFLDFNKAISDRAGMPHVSTVLPIARAMKNVETGVSDCLISASSPRATEKLLPVAVIIENIDAVIVTSPGIPITRIEDLHGKRLAIPRGSFRNFSITTDPHIERHLTNDYVQSVRLLKAGRVQSIAGSEFSIIFYFSVENIEREDVGGILRLKRGPLWLHCSKQRLSDDLIEKLRQSTDALREEGVFDELINRYIPPGFG